MAASLGTAVALGVSAANTTGAATIRYAFVSETLALTEDLVDCSGMVGSRSHPGERTRQGIRHVAGDLTLCPTPVDLVTILPWCLGAAASGTTFALAETLPYRDIDVDRVIKVPRYTTCYVNTATFRGSEGQPLEVSLDIMGLDETVNNSGTFPSISIDLTTKPYMFHELVLVINSVTYACKNWELSINNALELQHFNSQTPTRINATDRIVTLTTQLPYGDASAAYGLSSAGVAATATFTNGTVSCLFTTPSVHFPRNSAVTANARGELFLNLVGACRKSSSTAELTVTSDSTP